ncbi:MAG: hypothetical protein QOD39_3100, partial [Mycobacterium sp.]|nr:hypothetical protein [Mycobacterium sp.]
STRQRRLDLGVVLGVTMPAVAALEAAAPPDQRRALAMAGDVADPGAFRLVHPRRGKPARRVAQHLPHIGNDNVEPVRLIHNSLDDTQAEQVKALGHTVRSHENADAQITGEAPTNSRSLSLAC